MTTPAPRLALLALDLTGGDDAAVEAVLARVAQVIRHGTEREGATVGAVRAVLVSGVTVDDFLAAMASRKARDE